ncbi:bactericidal permeability-increasing protein-like [Ahaetulla prasina]|uniref:bactericidal permeability-increasing protein-like n=1 Tax=Ahaetulla prasina TaxID=499056 RepID=UPI002648312B|nr:bactericidal permeability-increasing protein-like [Ahaetulla prasina]
MRRISFLVFWLCCLVPSSEGVNPGFAGRITKKGLDYACQEGVATLQKDLPGITLPEFSGTYRVKIIGNVNYRFYSLNIRRFELFHSTIEPMPGQGLRVSVNNALAEMTGRWELKKRWLKDDGPFELKVDGISISVGLKLGSDGTGRPAVTPLDCNTHISNVDIDISGKWEWLYNLFESKVESAFKTVMERKLFTQKHHSEVHLAQQLPKIANTDYPTEGTKFLDVIPMLSFLPVTANIDPTSSIDYSLVGPPVATSDCVDLDLKGEFFSTAHRSPAPFPPPPLSFPVDHNRMVQFGISTYFFNTAGDVYYKAESLTFWVVDEMVPQEIKMRLNTSSFQPFIPQLKKLYPSMPMKLKISPSAAPSLSITPETLSLTPSVDMQAFAILPNSSLAPLFLIGVLKKLYPSMPMKLKISPSSAPSLSITPETLSLIPSVDMQAFAILPNSSLAPLFLIGVTSQVSANVAVNSTRIFGNLKLSRLKFSLKHSDVGFFSVQLLESLINFLTASILIPQMNARLDEGFPLPLLDQLELSNPVLQAHQDFLVFASDVRYG